MNEFVLKFLDFLIAPSFDGDVMNNADEDSLAVKLTFADRQVHGEGGAVLAASNYLASDADNVPFPVA
jgi:hypothetical protein